MNAAEPYADPAPLYLDHAATTPVRPEVLAAMWPYLTGVFGNPSSVHGHGRQAADALADARRRVARVLGVRPGDVVFTSGGSEANNLAIKGIALAAPGARHVVTTPIEHESVLRAVDYLVRLHGFEASTVGVDAAGLVDPEEAAAAVRDDTAVVSVGLANNEIGTVQPITEIAAALRRAPRATAGRPRPVRLHSDAVQAAGWLPLGLDLLGVDALTISGHKLGAPKGSGALVVRGRIPIEPLVHGGGQERGRRSGTENLAAAVALATALELAEAERAQAAEATARARDAFIAQVRGRIPNAILTGPQLGVARLPNVASFVFPGVAGEAVLIELERRGVIASAGSACAAGSDEPSHVLLAIGLDPAVAQTSLRFTLPHPQGSQQRAHPAAPRHDEPGQGGGSVAHATAAGAAAAGLVALARAEPYPPVSELDRVAEALHDALRTVHPSA